MKWENASMERKTEIVKRVCAYMGIRITQCLYADRSDFDGAYSFSFDDGTEFADVDSFLFGNLLEDHTPSPLSGSGLWSFEQTVQLGFTSLSEKARAAFDRLDFSSIPALELQLSAMGY